MAYGDKLFQDGVEHIESHDGAALCGYPAKGYYVERKPGLTICKSCEYVFERETTALERWNLGLGLEGSKPIQDNTMRVGAADTYRPPVTETPITPQPDTCDFPGCYLSAVHFTAAGTKYCQAHKPTEKVRGLGAFPDFDVLNGVKFKDKKGQR